jgi:hypothetical protein
MNDTLQVLETLRVVFDPLREAFYQDPEFHQDTDAAEFQLVLDSGCYRRFCTLNPSSRFSHAVEDLFGRWTLLRCIPVRPGRS